MRQCHTDGQNGLAGTPHKMQKSPTTRGKLTQNPIRASLSHERYSNVYIFGARLPLPVEQNYKKMIKKAQKRICTASRFLEGRSASACRAE